MWNNNENLFFSDNEMEEESEDDEDYIPSEDWKKVNFLEIFLVPEMEP